MSIARARVLLERFFSNSFRQFSIVHLFGAQEAAWRKGGANPVVQRRRRPAKHTAPLAPSFARPMPVPPGLKLQKNDLFLQVTHVTAGVVARLGGVACRAGAMGRRRLRVADLGGSRKKVQEGEHVDISGEQNCNHPGTARVIRRLAVLVATLFAVDTQTMR